MYAIPFAGGSPTKLADGRGAAVSRDGLVAFLQNGQIWMTLPDGRKSAVHTKASSSELEWSPDGTALAFTSDRGDHSFIGVYRVANKTVQYIDPSVDRDSSPVWSPDGRRIAFLRQAYSSAIPVGPAREAANPWSIRVADAATGASREVWRAARAPAACSAGCRPKPKFCGLKGIVWCSPGRATAGCISIRFRPTADARSSSRRASSRSSMFRFRATAARCCFPPIRTTSIAAMYGAWLRRVATLLRS